MFRFDIEKGAIHVFYRKRKVVEEEDKKEAFLVQQQLRVVLAALTSMSAAWTGKRERRRMHGSWGGSVRGLKD